MSPDLPQWPRGSVPRVSFAQNQGLRHRVHGSPNKKEKLSDAKDAADAEAIGTTPLQPEPNGLRLTSICLVANIIVATCEEQINASAGNRTRVTSMATMYSTTTTDANACEFQGF